MAKKAGSGRSTALGQRTIDGYRCTVHVATGGMGTIWKAVTPDRKTTVAVKIMNPDAAEDRDLRGSFKREYKLCRDFDHPGVLRYLAWGEFESLPYLVMDYFPAPTLRHAIANSPRRRVQARARTLVTHLAEALGYIHERGVIHRDLKPENILVDDEGNTRLIDFSAALKGMAKWLALGRKRSGTPSYMAPEQLANGRLGPGVDMYALGVTLFEMLAGRPPFTGEDDQEVLRQHLQAVPPPASRFNPDLSMALDKLLGQMLAKDPAARPPDMRAFLGRFAKTELFRN